MSTLHILIIGTGSAGRRHAKNLSSLGVAVFCFDPREDRLSQAKQEIPTLKGVYSSFEHVLAEASRFDGAVIASPPSTHVEQTIALLEREIPVLLEKPIAPDLASAVHLEEVAQICKASVLLGYTYRWWPPFLELRHQIKQKRLGALRHARFVMSAHLADWHPWEPYQDFFMAHRELGGGALLDESHFIDLMLWFFGMPEAIFGRVEHLSSLEITTDDNVDLVAIYPDNFRVTIHLDLFGRPHEKSITVVGEQGSLQCLFEPNVLRYAAQASGSWQMDSFSCERNDMFLTEVKDFVALIHDPSMPVACSVEDGVWVLRCVEAVRLSTQTGRTVAMAEICSKNSVS